MPEELRARADNACAASRPGPSCIALGSFLSRTNAWSILFSRNRARPLCPKRPRVGVELRRMVRSKSTPGLTRPLGTSGRAVLLGDRDLAATLSAGGVPVTAVCRRSNALRFSRYTDGWLEDPDSGEDALIRTLLGYAASSDQPLVLYYQTDDALLFTSRRRKELAEGGIRFVIAESALVEQLVNKAAFQDLATRLNLPTPPTHVIRVTAGNSDPMAMAPPFLVKPLRRDGSWEANNAAKAVLIRDRQQFNELVTKLRMTHSDVLLQSYVPGPESCVESYHVYVNSTGSIVAEFTGRKIRTYPTSYGYSTAVVTTRAEDVATHGRELVSKLRLRGVAKMDFKRDPAGKLWLLEVNPRFNLWHRLGAKAGINIPALVFQDLLGLPRPHTSPAQEGLTYCRGIEDWRAARQEGVSLLTWLRFVTGSETRSGLDPHDPLALLMGTVLPPPFEKLRQAVLAKVG
jgi:D-aspartate ligase